jgi:hypothetical protein
MDVKLLPCPDCGMPAEMKEAYFDDSNECYSYVHCTNPHCALYAHSLRFWGQSPSLNDKRAIDSWNRRFADTAPVSSVAHLSLVGN